MDKPNIKIELTDEEYENTISELTNMSKKGLIDFMVHCQMKGFEEGIKIGTRGTFSIVGKQIDGFIVTMPDNTPSMIKELSIGLLKTIKEILVNLEQQYTGQVNKIIDEVPTKIEVKNGSV